MASPHKPRLGVFKFASCDGCQLSLLDCEDELLAVAGVIDIAYFLEATRTEVAGPYDLSLVEGSITTAHDEERIREVRRQSRALVTIGACATAGGIQALRNYTDVAGFMSAVYARPDYISTLATSTPISAGSAGARRSHAAASRPSIGARSASCSDSSRRPGRRA